MGLNIRAAYDSPEEIRKLFGEYIAILVAGDPAFQHYLDLQNYDREIGHLEEKYGEPAGRLYLAEWDGAAAGCVALHRLSDTVAELKRLYVRPAFRRLGIGRALTLKIIEEARAAGYRTCRKTAASSCRRRSVCTTTSALKICRTSTTVRWRPPYI